MKRTCYAVIGIEQPWQEYVAMVTLNDGRRAACRMEASWPLDDPIPPRVKRRMWRECVRVLRVPQRVEHPGT